MVGFCFVRSLLCVDSDMVLGVKAYHLWSRFQSLMFIVAAFGIHVAAFQMSLLQIVDLVLGHSWPVWPIHARTATLRSLAWFIHLMFSLGSDRAAAHCVDFSCCVDFGSVDVVMKAGLRLAWTVCFSKGPQFFVRCCRSAVNFHGDDEDVKTLCVTPPVSDK